MALRNLEHVNIHCADLDRSRVFYGEALGLVDGERPAVASAGAWFYAGDRAVVHLVAGGDAEAVNATGNFDHVAFEADDMPEVISRLRRLNIPFRESGLPGMRIRQIFVHDPDGV